MGFQLPVRCENAKCPKWSTSTLLSFSLNKKMAPTTLSIIYIFHDLKRYKAINLLMHLKTENHGAVYHGKWREIYR